ncbi:MAG: hypothetical protein J3K34DRAFT_444191 [Monoraphidium minutum]|nr:MAG: hypothetical protein J3K34DRAFT_444191 [Monoraphidium minutum]
MRNPRALVATRHSMGRAWGARKTKRAAEGAASAPPQDGGTSKGKRAGQMSAVKGTSNRALGARRRDTRRPRPRHARGARRGQTRPRRDKRHPPPAVQTLHASWPKAGRGRGHPGAPAASRARAGPRLAARHTPSLIVCVRDSGAGMPARFQIAGLLFLGRLVAGLPFLGCHRW